MIRAGPPLPSATARLSPLRRRARNTPPSTSNATREPTAATAGLQVRVLPGIASGGATQASRSATLGIVGYVGFARAASAAGRCAPPRPGRAACAAIGAAGTHLERAARTIPRSAAVLPRVRSWRPEARVAGRARPCDLGAAGSTAGITVSLWLAPVSFPTCGTGLAFAGIGEAAGGGGAAGGRT